MVVVRKTSKLRERWAEWWAVNRKTKQTNSSLATTTATISSSNQKDRKREREIKRGRTRRQIKAIQHGTLSFNAAENDERRGREKGRMLKAAPPQDDGWLKNLEKLEEEEDLRKRSDFWLCEWVIVRVLSIVISPKSEKGVRRTKWTEKERRDFCRPSDSLVSQ